MRVTTLPTAGHTSGSHSTGSHCGACQAPLQDGWQLCHKCTIPLESDLEAVAGVWEDVMVSGSRLDVSAPSVGGGGQAGSQEPANLEALDRAQALRIILGKYSSLLPTLSPFGEPPVKAAWLFTQVPAIRKMRWAAEFAWELRDALNACRKVTDRAPQQVFAGICPMLDEDANECGNAVFTRPGRPKAQCRKCGAWWDASEWRSRAMRAAGVREGTAAELSRIISDPITGETIQPATIRQWVRRKKLVAIGVDAKGRPTYQVRKVRNLWARMQASAFGNPTHKRQLVDAA